MNIGQLVGRYQMFPRDMRNRYDRTKLVPIESLRGRVCDGLNAPLLVYVIPRRGPRIFESLCSPQTISPFSELPRNIYWLPFVGVMRFLGGLVAARNVRSYKSADHVLVVRNLDGIVAKRRNKPVRGESI